jgi:hypothetical protein
MKYKYTDDMAELSGFGGGYEATCRAMVVAGLDWLDANPTADPKFYGYKHVYGIINEDNDDAKALTAVVLEAADGEATGAMHQASISHIVWIKAHGWEQYCQESRERKAKEQS